MGGSGVFRKDDVLSIIHDLRNTLKTNQSLDESNKLYKRLLWSAIAFCFLLLSGMFGLSYAVAALTKNSQVSASANLMSLDGKSLIATDATANLYKLGPHPTGDDNSVYCVPTDEAVTMTEQALSGRNVLLELGDYGGENTQAVVEELSARGAVKLESTGEQGKTCFPAPELGEQMYLCVDFDAPCTPTMDTAE